MKIRASFQKEEVRVGLSSFLPIIYRDIDEKYVLADYISPTSPGCFEFEKDIIKWELEITSDELFRTSESANCHYLISIMPDDAISEVEESLTEIYQHYTSIEEANKEPTYLPATKEVAGFVVDRVKT